MWTSRLDVDCGLWTSRLDVEIEDWTSLGCTIRYLRNDVDKAVLVQLALVKGLKTSKPIAMSKCVQFLILFFRQCHQPLLPWNNHQRDPFGDEKRL